MDKLPALFAILLENSLLILLLVTVFSAGRFLFNNFRQRFHQWRLRRRLAADEYILADEMREYEQAIGDELKPIKWWVLPFVFVLALPDMAGGDIGRLYELEWPFYLFLAVPMLVIVAISSIWNYYRKSPEEREKIRPSWPAGWHLPKEAMLGFLAAIFLVGIMVIGILKFN